VFDFQFNAYFSILVNRAHVGACDHSFLSSISGKNFVENGSTLSEFAHVPPTSTPISTPSLIYYFIFSSYVYTYINTRITAHEKQNILYVP
jgi:hypothetical protein